jgi:hypothetical protein
MSSGLKHLLSDRVVIGFPEQRLTYLTKTIAEKRAEYCVVLQEKTQRFLGMLRIADVAATPSAQFRILLDLITDEKFPVALPTLTADALHEKLIKGEKGVVAIVDHEDEFVGLVTIESYALWELREVRKRARMSRDGLSSRVNVLPFENPRSEDERRDA